MIHIFSKRASNKSGSIARDRLKLLLVSDRANCSPEIMDLIKNDLVNVISKYMDIDRDGLEISMVKSKRNNTVVPYLYANIPIKRVNNK
jgi:cell division topological specificity factor